MDHFVGRGYGLIPFVPPKLMLEFNPPRKMSGGWKHDPDNVVTSGASRRRPGLREGIRMRPPLWTTNSFIRGDRPEDMRVCSMSFDV